MQKIMKHLGLVGLVAGSFLSFGVAGKMVYDNKTGENSRVLNVEQIKQETKEKSWLDNPVYLGLISAVAGAGAVGYILYGRDGIGREK